MVRMLLGVYVLMQVRDVSVFSPVVHASTKILRCGRAGEDVRVKQEEIADVRVGFTA